MLDERCDAKDRIMSPIVTLSELPEAQTRDEHGPVSPARELLDPSEKRIAIDRCRRGLNDPRLRMQIHDFCQAHQGLAGHDTVGIENNDVIIVSTPSAQKIRDISALSSDVVAPMAIEDFTEAVNGPARFCPRDFLFDLLPRIGAIT